MDGCLVYPYRKLLVGDTYGTLIITSQLEHNQTSKILEEYQVEYFSEDCREFSFKNYYAKSIVNEDGNIFVNGNRALFLEPIQATSLVVMDSLIDMILDRIENEQV